jgi:hypothetical protein
MSGSLGCAAIAETNKKGSNAPVILPKMKTRVSGMHGRVRMKAHVSRMRPAAASQLSPRVMRLFFGGLRDYFWTWRAGNP